MLDGKENFMSVMGRANTSVSTGWLLHGHGRRREENGGTAENISTAGE